MPRKALGPRLYLDKERRQWIIRNDTHFIRTGLNEDAFDEAQERLLEYQAKAPKPSKALPIEQILGFIYFATAAYPNYPIKIGFTERLGGARLRSLQVACPYPIVLVGHMKGSMFEESVIHRQFDHLRMMGEWFRRDKELMEFIQGYCGNTFNPMV